MNISGQKMCQSAPIPKTVQRRNSGMTALEMGQTFTSFTTMGWEKETMNRIRAKTVSVTEIAEKNGRSYITPKDVSLA